MSTHGIVNTYNLPYTSSRASPTHRRLRAVIFDIPHEMPLFTEGAVVSVRCVEGLPKDARYVGAVAETFGLSVFCIFEHESFSPVPSGHYIPVQAIRYESVTE